MRTVEDIISALHLTEGDITRLSSEAKEHAVGCGKKESTKELSEETWNLFSGMSEKVWDS